jgi:hypothetical protein
MPFKYKAKKLIYGAGDDRLPIAAFSGIIFACMLFIGTGANQPGG